MFNSLETIILSFIQTLPLEVFVLVASFLEEVIAPIPSSGVLLATGGIAAVQGLTLPDLVPIIFMATIGKTFGAILIYYLSDRVGKTIITKYGHIFKISYTAIEKFSSKINHTKRDYLFLTIFRALPIFPSVVISMGCGLLKIPLKMFIVSTFLGTLVRDGIFLYIGFRGTQFLNTIASKRVIIESAMQIAVVSSVLALIIYLYFKKRQSKHISTKTNNS